MAGWIDAGLEATAEFTNRQATRQRGSEMVQRPLGPPRYPTLRILHISFNKPPAPADH